MSPKIHTRAARGRARGPLRSLLRAAAVALVALGAAIAVPAPASAHDQLVGTDPADGATLTALPAQITLTFSDAVLPDPGATAVEVTDPAGAPVADGEATTDGATVTQTLRADAADPNGRYTVAWKVVSSDGHPVSGTFAFTVAGAPIATPTPTTTPTASSSPTPTESALPGPPMEAQGGIPTWVWVVLGVLVVAAMGAVVAVLVARARGSRDRG